MAKQTFTTGQVLTAAQQNSLQANDFNQTVSVKTANYSLLAADKGTRIEFNTSGSVTCTVNSGEFDAGDTLIIQNRGAGTATITAGTATVNTSASLALSQYSAGTLYFVSDSAALFFGDAAGISASLIDAKGDLIVGTADNTVGRLPVGTNGHTLVADSVETTGLKWVAPAAPGFKGFSASINSGATPTASTNTKVPFGSEAYDTESWYDTSLYRFLPTTSGYYRITVSAYGNATGRNRFDLYKNGSSILRVFDPPDNHKGILGHSGITVNLNGSSDYIEVYYFGDGTTGPWQQGTDVSNFSAFYLGA